MKLAKLENLAQEIRGINSALQESASKAINKHLTSRNWLIGYCIIHYEQHGEDRARYGEKILQNLAKEINDGGLSYRNLKLFRQFYTSFPNLGSPIYEYLTHIDLIGQLAIAQLRGIDSREDIIRQSTIAKSTGNR